VTRLSDQRGFTLVELLVGSTVSMIVLFGVLTFLDVSFTQSARVQARVDNLQRGRQAMEVMTQQIRSQVCLGPGVPPIIQGDDSSMTFYTDLGDESFTPEKRQLTYSNGTITENDYVGTGTPPNMTWPATPTRTKTLITDITPVTGVPVFRYYGFEFNPVTPNRLQTTPLDGNPTSSADNAAARTVKVGISFVALPSRSPSTSVKTTFQNEVYSRTSDPTDPEHSPQCN
jgi:type II secretory pathway pseudopilin PulG